jgi:hypothetical protein
MITTEFKKLTFTFIDWLGSDIKNKYLHAYIVTFSPFFLLRSLSLNSSTCLAVPQSSAINKNAYTYTFSTSPYAFMVCTGRILPLLDLRFSQQYG